VGDQATVEVEAPPGRVYGLIVSVCRLGEQDPEAYTLEWSSTEWDAVPGTCFLSKARLGLLSRETRCTVIEAVPGEAFSFLAGDEREGVIRLAYSLEQVGSCTRVKQSREVVFAPQGASDVARRMMRLPWKLSRKRAMQKTLDQIKAAAELVDLERRN
jgi:hypothetical protein